MALLALKLTLSPLTIACASLLARRFGPTLGGWVIGLPVTAGPVALVLELQHGAAFTARVADGFVAGVTAQAAFVLGYVALARRRASSAAAVAAGCACFFAAGLPLEAAGLPASLLLVCALLVVVIGLRLVPPQPGARDLAPARRSLVIRMAAATSLVLVVTSVASTLGPGLSGLVTTFPLLTTILAVSVHRADPRAAVAVYRGLLLGLFALCGFAATLALVLAHAPVGLAFALALALTAMIQLGSFATVRRSLEPRP